MARITPQSILGLVLVIVFLTVLLSVANSVIPTGATAYHNLSDTLAGQGAVIGTDAASFAGNTDDYVGWFWVIGPFALVITLVLGVFMRKRR